jgi:DNA ligase (NAD+)
MNADQAKKEIANLTQKLNHHNELYYQQNRTEISDHEFDAMLESLVKLEEQFPPPEST